MRRFSIFLLVTLAAMANACGSATPAGETPGDKTSADKTSGEGDSCPLVDAGPPPQCPEGCFWNGQDCRTNSSIVMPDVKDDGGTQNPH